MVDEQLWATVEELREGPGPVGGLEAVLLLDRHPRKLPALLRQFVATAGELLLLREQLVAGGLPLLLRSDLVLRHCLASDLRAGALIVFGASSGWIFVDLGLSA